MKFLLAVFLMLAMTVTVTEAAPISQPKERTTLGEVYQYICDEYVTDGVYSDDSGMWACIPGKEKR